MIKKSMTVLCAAALVAVVGYAAAQNTATPTPDPQTNATTTPRTPASPATSTDNMSTNNSRSDMANDPAMAEPRRDRN